MNAVKWVLTPSKFLTLEEVAQLLKFVRVDASTAIKRGCVVAVRDWFVVELGLATGLRVSEMSQLNCGDLFVQSDSNGLLVRKGKGGKQRLVLFNEAFRRICLG